MHINKTLPMITSDIRCMSAVNVNGTTKLSVSRSELKAAGIKIAGSMYYRDGSGHHHALYMRETLIDEQGEDVSGWRYIDMDHNYEIIITND